MPRITKVQAAHTYGVLDPHLADRDDTKFVNGSLSDGRNIIMLPQGGYTRRGGTTDFGRVRRGLTAETYTSGMVTLPNGGVVADYMDGDTITTSAASGSRHVLAEVDFGAARRIHMIDIGTVKAATTGAAGGLVCEYWTGSAWATFGTPLLLTTTARSRRFASGAPGHSGVLASRFRISASATAGVAGAISFTRCSFFAEGATLTDAVQWRHSPGKNLNCLFVVSPMNVDVFESGLWKAAFFLPADEAILREIKPEAKYESILEFHQTMQPHKAVMLDSVSEWSCDPVAFANIPEVDYGLIYANGVTAEQSIQFYSTSTGDLFELMLEGQLTASIEFNNDPLITSANIKAALESLSIVSPGLTVAQEAGSGYKIKVTFTGDGNENREWLTMSGTIQAPGKFVTVRNVKKGKAGGEDIISATRGWPATGRFAQQRLVMAGLKSRPTDMLATMTGSSDDLNTDLGIATAAISYEVEATNNTEVRDLAIGGRLIFLGDEQATYLRTVTLSATEAPSFGSSDAPGIAPNCPIVSSDNALFYIQEGGNTLRILTYTELEQNYVGDNASLLSAHLVRQVKSLTRRRAVGAIDSDLLLMTNGDGTITALTLMRTQEVSGFAPWVTDGEYSHSIVDNANVLWHLVKRGTGTGQTLRLERADPDGLLDEAEHRTYAAPVSVLTGLQRFEGRAVHVVNADLVLGPFTVNGGQVDLQADVSGTVTIGTWIAPRATDHDYRPEAETQRRMARMKRVNRVQLSLIDTTNVAIEVNGSPAIDIPLTANDAMDFDLGELARPFTGTAEAEGMHGFTSSAKMTVTQLRPGRITVRAATKDIVA